ncbi:hypothetical protein CGRA01v4_04145 [Colletotrichum graminicola]|nr:hypothetical protein CGRA01v4_04145 [Colletotrichum graminicola]
MNLNLTKTFSSPASPIRPDSYCLPPHHYHHRLRIDQPPLLHSPSQSLKSLLLTSPQLQDTSKPPR